MPKTLGILLFAVLMYLYVENRIGYRTFLELIAFIGSCYIFSFIHMNYVDYVKNKKLKETCQHGIIGAKIDIFKCLECKMIAELQQEEIRENKLKEEAELQQEEIRENKLKEEAELQQEEIRENTHKEKSEKQILRQKQYYEERNSKIRLPEYLKTMDPIAFEKLVCDLFRRIGYDATETPYVGEGAFDGYLRRDGHLYLLQCKRTKGSVGESIIRDLFGSVTAHKAAGGIIVTTGSVSDEAKKWAAYKPLDIIEMKQLIELIKKYYAENDVVPDNYGVPRRKSVRT